MKYYLCRTTTCFYDPHGSTDEGEVKLEVLKENKFKISIDTEKVYWENGGVFREFEEGMDDDIYPEDGYNHHEDFFQFIEIKEDEVKMYKNIIKQYIKLVKSFNDLKL